MVRALILELKHIQALGEKQSHIDEIYRLFLKGFVSDLLVIMW